MTVARERLTRRDLPEVLRGPVRALARQHGVTEEQVVESVLADWLARRWVEIQARGEIPVYEWLKSQKEAEVLLAERERGLRRELEERLWNDAQVLLPENHRGDLRFRDSAVQFMALRLEDPSITDEMVRGELAEMAADIASPWEFAGA